MHAPKAGCHLVALESAERNHGENDKISDVDFTAARKMDWIPPAPEVKLRTKYEVPSACIVLCILSKRELIRQPRPCGPSTESEAEDRVREGR